MVHIMMHIMNCMHIIVMMYIDAYYDDRCHDAFYYAYYCCYAYYCYDANLLHIIIIVMICIIVHIIVVMHITVMMQIDAYFVLF